MSIKPSLNITFARRHIGPNPSEIQQMLDVLHANTLDEFIASVIPPQIRTKQSLSLDPPLSERETIRTLHSIASKNQVFRSLIGMGYYDTITPTVIQRNVLENSGWYTQYTPYQAEIAQGRLEALLNFQTMVIDLTGLPVANASLLDEATAAAEAMTMFYGIKGRPQNGIFFVSDDCFPQTIGVMKTRAKPLNIRVVVGDYKTFEFSENVFGALLQYPASDGAIYDYRSFIERAHSSNSLVAIAADLLSLTLLIPPGELAADAAVGNTQRFGVPLGYGGPHAAYFATKDEFKRHIPGRIIGVSVDSRGKRALRMALQTREQHIRREKATSNICTAQVLLAIMASMYAVYHGPQVLKEIAERIHNLAKILARGLEQLGYTIRHTDFFDTLHFNIGKQSRSTIQKVLKERKLNVRWFDDGTCGVSIDECSNEKEVELLLEAFGGGRKRKVSLRYIGKDIQWGYQGHLRRTSQYLLHPVFNKYHSETEMMRYIKSLEEKDLSLTMSMIPLGSCTMKLNAATELFPVTWQEFNSLHPFIPQDQAKGYTELFKQLESMLCAITGFSAVSLQPNSGAQGEYTGLLVIQAYHESRGEKQRDVCLIPSSAHGTNPASAVMAGMNVVVVRAKDDGTIDIADLRAKALQYQDRLGALMVTYPSTHGVFEEEIKDICGIIHQNGGLVYMDGANLNAQVGLCRPAELGADICHLNLHKTFCIPHGGGGPGMGPIAVTKELASFLPSHPVIKIAGRKSIGPVSAAPWGSPSILPVSWAYIMMMGGEGLTEATKIAILNANYMASRLEKYYPILYTGLHRRVAHEFIIDCRQFKNSAGIEAEDIAKRLMDYGFHAPTVSFPVPGTLMIEPTESESKDELDRFCDALIYIRSEIEEIEKGEVDREMNVLKNAPHPAEMVVSDSWNLPYSREKAAYPAPWTRMRKFWVKVGRVNSAYGDRNLVCACPPTEEYAFNSERV